MEFIENHSHREPTCEEMAWALARITQLETALKNILADYWCTHSCMDCSGMGSCPERENCQCSHCRGRALFEKEGK